MKTLKTDEPEPSIPPPAVARFSKQIPVSDEHDEDMRTVEIRPSRFKISTLALSTDAPLPLSEEMRENLMNMRRDVIAFLRRLDEMLGLEQTIPRRKR